MSRIFSRLRRFPPRRGPEWGSGGIFGLRYHRGVLYYTAAFEAEAHFVEEERERVYRFELVGDGPRSGGDTYNAVETVDEFIYFGGWVNSPVVFSGKADGTSRIFFDNKYAHVHRYDTVNDEVKLLWKESVHRRDEWAAEVGDIVYDPFGDRLLLAREDGHFNTGIYSLDRRTGEARMINHERSLKGTVVHDTACFGVGENFDAGLRAVHFLDLVSDRWERFGLDGGSVDGAGFFKPALGELASAYNRVFAFVRGGVFVGNPLNQEPMTFIRLFDFHNFYAPFRTNSIALGGGILIPFNAHHDAVYSPSTEEARNYSDYTNTITAPSTLVYVAPPMAKVVGVFGARITSVEKLAGKIILAADTTPNAGGPTVTPYDSGEKDFVVVDESAVNGPPPAFSFTYPLSLHSKMRSRHGASAFGGVPLYGYRNALLEVFAARQNTLTIHEYDLMLPTQPATSEKFAVKEGRNVFDLFGFGGIVSFQLEAEDPRGKVRLFLS
ncbi:MAG: DUF2139 domain-containing protein [Candidatus Caldarchaeum sp.]|nr:DUF2139 domain-containing protein [Candidatus Caldarchaeum sp.]MDW8359897.1 DUF2139 domain-containing protein [Candidatus Caldarchaeum sp.]